jgi:hypothetical protein
LTAFDHHSEVDSLMGSRSWFAVRGMREPRAIVRQQPLTVEPLEDRRLLAPVPAQVEATQLSAVVGSGIYAGTATLTADLTAAGKPLPDELVAFTVQTGATRIDVGSTVTDSSGHATLPDVPLAGLRAGVYTGAVAASFAGDASDSPSNAGGNLTVSPAQATLTLGNLIATYNGAAQAVSVSTNPAGLSGVSITYIQNHLAVAAPTTAGSYAATATLNNPDYTAAAVSDTLIIDKVTPPVTWADPADIVYGTPLGPAQLDATSPIAGTFSYTQTTGIVLNAGAGQVLSGTFTPTDTVDYTSATATVTINVAPAAPAITWARPADIVYGTPLDPSQLDATASVPGSFVYTPAAGAVLGAGRNQTLALTFTPIDANDYSTETATVPITVLPATPIIAWPPPLPFVYGTPLGPAQLDSIATVPGTFTYTPATGTVLAAGAAQTVLASFTPDDTTDYTANTASVLVNVVQAPLTITVSDASRVYGQPNPDFSVSYSGFVNGDTPGDLAGTLSFDTSAASASDAGSYDILASGLSSSNYSIRQIKGTLTVTPADQTITWSKPADIIYSTPLGATQLDATVSVIGPAPAGALTYTPAAGTIPGAGGSQALSVVAAATSDYNQASATVPINVQPATPVIAWGNPADVVYGTPLGVAQLDASVSAPDAATIAISYSPPAGTILPAGSGQTLTANTAATANDNAASATVTINVLPATPTIAWPGPADIAYGTPLGAAQLDATASVPGSFTYTPSPGTVLDAGPDQMLMATFTPADPVDYRTVTVATPLNVTRATLVATANDAAATYGALIPMLSGSVSGLLNNDPVGVTFTTAAMIGSPVGSYAIMPVLVDPNDRMGNYQVVLDYAKLTIGPAPLMVTASGASITLGQSVPAFTVYYTGLVHGDGADAVQGTPTFTLPAGAGSQPGFYPVTPEGLSAANYTISYVDGFLNVTAPVVTVQGASWQTRRSVHRRAARVLVVIFSGALDPADSQNPGAYHLVPVSRGSTISPRASKPIPLAAVAYDPMAHTITLTPRGKVPHQTLQLSIDAALVLDAQGRPIDGNRDGRPGGTYVATLKGL